MLIMLNEVTKGQKVAKIDIKWKYDVSLENDPQNMPYPTFTLSEGLIIPHMCNETQPYEQSVLYCNNVNISQCGKQSTFSLITFRRRLRSFMET